MNDTSTQNIAFSQCCEQKEEHMNIEERIAKELHLAFYMGALAEDMDFLEAIPYLTDEDLDEWVARKRGWWNDSQD